MATFTNPVYLHYFADPCVWKHENVYYAAGTGPLLSAVRDVSDRMESSREGNSEAAFPMLRSLNFADWSYLHGALIVPKQLQGAEFWAPEVAFNGSDFYLYFSAATQGLNHQLHVASSSKPSGPFHYIGPLMQNPGPEPFAIDAHPFQDDDGSWYLFYARDFPDFDGQVHAGTALVVDRLLNMERLAGEEKVVLRARNNWQLFKAQRPMYGKVFDWHTLEGPFVRKHNGKYYCFYSGGCYENASYGVDYGVSSHVLGPYSDLGNESGPRVLKTVPDQVIGPGHHTIVAGPDNQSEYIAYHAWDRQMSARRMFLDRLIWTEEGPRCLGPTWTAQEVPSLRGEMESEIFTR